MPDRLKPASSQLVLGPATTSLTDRVLAALPSPETRRSYARAFQDLAEFAHGRPLTLPLLLEWRAQLLTRITPASVNPRIYAVRHLIRAAHRSQMITAHQAWELLELRGRRPRGTRTGNWLTQEQARRLLNVPAGGPASLRAVRNRAILAIFAGCAIRIHELAALNVESYQQRVGRWVFADIAGKGGKLRTVPVPTFTVQAIRAWLQLSKIKSGRLIRKLSLGDEGLSMSAIRRIVRLAGEKVCFQRLRPHDLRRTCAKLAREAGGDLEQIQALLGHDSLDTTRIYLGTQQNLRDAPNDHLGL